MDEHEGLRIICCFNGQLLCLEEEERHKFCDRDNRSVGVGLVA